MQKFQLTISEDSLKQINTRFGLIDITPENVYQFPDGLYQNSKSKLFALSYLPLLGFDDKFMILQNLESPDVGFVLLNVLVDDRGAEHNLIDYQDLLPILNKNELTLDQVSVHCLITLQRDTGVPIATANLQKPIILHPELMYGWQLSLDSNKYQENYVIDNLYFSM